MHSRICLLSAVMAGATILAASTAIADEMPKEGTYLGTSSSKGVVTQSYTVGKGEGFVVLYDEYGTTSGGEKQHCFGLSQAVKGVEQAMGYCISTFPDGDQVLIKTTTEPRPVNTPTMHGTDQAVMGTGKFAGITATDTFTCQQSGDGTQYTSNCEAKGSYKLP
jgi:hypothetical protein